eukprot:10078331-Alexandrium_andersonii.AAC.1
MALKEASKCTLRSGYLAQALLKAFTRLTTMWISGSRVRPQGADSARATERFGAIRLSRASTILVRSLFKAVLATGTTSAA